MITLNKKPITIFCLVLFFLTPALYALSGVVATNGSGGGGYNNPPTAEWINPPYNWFEVTEEGLFIANLEATDLDGDDLDATISIDSWDEHMQHQQGFPMGIVGVRISPTKVRFTHPIKNLDASYNGWTFCLTMIITDGEDGITATTYFTVDINTPPIVSSPPDISFTVGSEGNSITWSVSDDDLWFWEVDGWGYGLDFYDWGIFTGETEAEITIELDGLELELGAYKFEIGVYDDESYTKDLVRVDVITTEPTPPTTDYTFGHLLRIGRAGENTIEFGSFDANGDDLTAEISIRHWGESDNFVPMTSERLNEFEYSHTYTNTYEEEDNGWYIIHFFVSDGEFFSHYILYLEIHINRPPLMTKIKLPNPDTTPPIIEITYTGDYTIENSGELIVYAYDPENKLTLDPTETYGVPVYIGTHIYRFTAINFARPPLETNVIYEVIITEAGLTTCELIEELMTEIEDSPDEIWAKNPEQRRNAMINKIEECIAKCEAEEYEELTNKLNNDIRPKLTGMKLNGKSFKNAWIIDSEYQEIFEAKINAILDSM